MYQMVYTLAVPMSELWMNQELVIQPMICSLDEYGIMKIITQSFSTLFLFYICNFAFIHLVIIVINVILYLLTDKIYV